jgi:hypothetical protein
MIRRCGRLVLSPSFVRINSVEGLGELKNGWLEDRKNERAGYNSGCQDLTDR